VLVSCGAGGEAVESFVARQGATENCSIDGVFRCWGGMGPCQTEIGSGRTFTAVQARPRWAAHIEAIGKPLQQPVAAGVLSPNLHRTFPRTVIWHCAGLPV